MVVAYVHLFTLFMVVPIFNPMARIDQSAARGGARRRRRPLARGRARSCCRCRKTGIALGSIFVVTLVMGDSFVVRTMSGGQSASVVSALQNEIAALQYPPAAANAVIMVIIVTLMVAAHPARWSTCARNWCAEVGMAHALADGTRPWTFYVLRGLVQRCSCCSSTGR